LVKNADRVFYFDEGQRAEARIVVKAVPRTGGARPGWNISMISSHRI
jgi:hypothetical protein